MTIDAVRHQIHEAKQKLLAELRRLRRVAQPTPTPDRHRRSR